MPSIHPEIKKSMLLSDHIKQIADCKIKDVKFRIVNHNMLIPCRNEKFPNNAWNICESDEQYQERLKLLAENYKQEISNKNNVIIGLQEAPKDANNFFELMNLDSSWNYKSGTMYKEFMLIYNSNIITVNEVIEMPYLKCNIYKCTANDQEFNLINVHIHYPDASDDKLDQTKEKLAEIMNRDHGINIRFGDHNANESRFTDLKTWQNDLPTSFAYDTHKSKEMGKAIFSFIDKRDECLGVKKLYKNYDGFAFSEKFDSENNDYSYILHPSQTLSPYPDNTGFIVNNPPVLGNISDEVIS